MTNDLTPSMQQTLPTTPEDWSAYYAAMAEETAAQERRAGNTISLRNMQMSVADQPIPGNQFAAVILDYVRLNTWYGEAFNPSNRLPPRCYAVGRSDAEMVPHPDMQKDLEFFQMQADRCGACPKNEFVEGRKQCSNKRKLALLIAGTYQWNGQQWVLSPYTDPEYYASSAIFTLSVAPTGLAAWGDFVRDTAAKFNRPFFGVVSRVWLYSHPKHGKETLGFEPLAETPLDWAPILAKRQQEATMELFQGYEPPKRGTQQGGAPGGFYGVQRQAQQPG